jgi:hypothetical protein
LIPGSASYSRVPTLRTIHTRCTTLRSCLPSDRAYSSSITPRHKYHSRAAIDSDPQAT